MHRCSSFLRQPAGNEFALLSVFEVNQIYIIFYFILFYTFRASNYKFIKMKEINRNMIIIMCTCAEIITTGESFQWVRTAANYFVILAYAVCMEANWI